MSDQMAGPGGPRRPRLALVHTAAEASAEPGAPARPGGSLPPIFTLLAGSGPGPAPGRPGRRRQALVVAARVPQGPQDVSGRSVLSHAASLRRLGYQVVFAPADGRLDRPIDEAGETGLAEAGIECVGLPSFRAVEEVLQRRGTALHLVLLHEAAMAHAYEPLVRLHAPGARVLFSGAELPLVAPAGAGSGEGDAVDRLRQRRALMAAYASDATVVHTAAAAAALRGVLPDTAVHVVPWSVPVRPAARQRRSGVGVLSRPGQAGGQDAARFVVRAVMPLVWAQDPAIPLVFAEEGDGGAVLNQVRVTVAAGRCGAEAGLVADALDSLARGVPCAVSPPVGAALGLPSGLADTVGADAAGLARAILALHRDPASAAAAGLAHVRAGWSDAAVDAALRPALGAPPRIRRAAR